MLVPDVMHEIELGVGKAYFTHLLRVLVAQGGPSIQELNARYAAYHLVSIHILRLTLLEDITDSEDLMRRFSTGTSNYNSGLNKAYTILDTHL